MRALRAVCIAAALTLTGCGHSIDQVKKIAHDAIEIGGAVYDDVKDHAKCIKGYLDTGNLEHCYK